MTSPYAVTHDATAMRGFFRTYGAAVASGLLLALSFPSFGMSLVAWVALVPLFRRACGLRPREAFMHFLIAGWAFYALLLQWMMTNVYWAGGWAFLGYQGVCLIMALYWGLLGAVWAWLRGRGKWGGGPAGMALLWVTMEFLQAHLFTGFGWGSLAYSQGRNLPVMQWAAVGGGTLVSGVVVLFAVLVATALTEHGRKRFGYCLAALGVLAVCYAGGTWMLDEPDYDTSPLRVGVIQTDFPLEMKWDPEYSEEMVRNACEKSRLLCEHEDVDLLVWPEAAIMTRIATPAVNDMLTALTRETGAALYTGGQRIDLDTGGHFNSSYLINADGQIVEHYDKTHLAPFGEYVPLSDYLPFLGKIIPAIGNVQRGEDLKVLPVNGRKLGPLICFEVLFPGLAEELRGLGADCIVVITNLGWFGASNAIPQELEQARTRAIETRLPIVHCANTGLSGVFDPWGRFSLLNAAASATGRYYTFDGVPNEATIMRRAMGAFSVAAPGKRPIPNGPRVFPWLALVICAGWAGWGLLTGRRDKAPPRSLTHR